MKKIFVGFISVLLSSNANAALISFSDYGSSLYGGSRYDTSLIESAAPQDFTVDIEPLGTFRDYSILNGESTNEEGELISLTDIEEKYYDIAPAPFAHAFSEEMALLESTFQPGDSLVKSESSSEFGIHYSKRTYTELGKSAPYYGQDEEIISLSITGGYHQSWKKNINGLFVGQHIISYYELTLTGDALTTNPDFSNYDDLDELYAALERNITDGGSFRILQKVTVLSYEKTNPNTSIWCSSCEGLTITDDKYLRFSSYGRVNGVDYVDVPESSTNILLALGLIGLMRFKRRTQV
ncbi:PEP-CTERM sorting domain-containing protein [Thalassomonas actiniarum]|uniref:PEP-CTERM sorting domain-containing protein n=1 Tax=Thalassomonas actiniarum TaxID=485447 RepID=A0AAE9YTQ5_9GAMM|nr:PEP-CTERM sorting domain-containing protein [Thalassomonas actiniarum]WDE00144.1 PEP-CTERM sorting domain-containing protein [Thalassomonas actiniarum]